MRILTIITIINIMGLLACASTNNTKSTKKNYSRDRISSEEIRNTGSSDAYELIQRLRPIWLQGRGPKSVHSLKNQLILLCMWMAASMAALILFLHFSRLTYLIIQHNSSRRAAITNNSDAGFWILDDESDSFIQYLASSIIEYSWAKC